MFCCIVCLMLLRLMLKMYYICMLNIVYAQVKCFVVIYV